MLPLDLLRVFDERVMELLIGGVSEIDLDHWTVHRLVRVREDGQQGDRVVLRKACLLQFTTGSSREAMACAAL